MNMHLPPHIRKMIVDYAHICDKTYRPIYEYIDELKYVFKHLFYDTGEYRLIDRDVLEMTQERVWYNEEEWLRNNPIDDPDEPQIEPLACYEEVDYVCKFCGWREENEESHIQCGNFGCWYLHHKYVLGCDDGDMYIIKKKPVISQLFLSIGGPYPKSTTIHSDSESESDSDSDSD